MRESACVWERESKRVTGWLREWEKEIIGEGRERERAQGGNKGMNDMILHHIYFLRLILLIDIWFRWVIFAKAALCEFAVGIQA